jgi:hypothetical protein
VVPNIGNPAIPLVMNGRLIRRAALQIVETDEAHVRSFWRVADFLGGRQDGHTNEQSDDNWGATAEINRVDFGSP